MKKGLITLGVTLAANALLIFITIQLASCGPSLEERAVIEKAAKDKARIEMEIENLQQQEQAPKLTIKLIGGAEGLWVYQVGNDTILVSNGGILKK